MAPSAPGRSCSGGHAPQGHPSKISMWDCWPMGARIEVDGRPATVDDLAHPVLVNFGHFTSMQVRGRRVRGLRHHLDRLTAANRELFGADLDPELVRALIRRALTD